MLSQRLFAFFALFMVIPIGQFEFDDFFKEKIAFKPQPVSISPKDDAYHGPYHIPTTEWWYFDAIFENGYAIHTGISVHSVEDQGVMRYVVEIYKDGKLLERSSMVTIFLPSLVSKDYPCIRIGDKVIMYLDLKTFRENGKWKYKLYIRIGKTVVDLIYVGTTVGWKCCTEREGWVVPLPKALVYGRLTLGNENLEVYGTGYHDHNWNYSVLTGIDSKGWYWGRIGGKRLSLTWAEIRNRWENDTKIATLNFDSDGYIGIDQENISILTLDFINVDGLEIPTKIIILVDDNKVHASITLVVTDYHPINLFILRYCRLFVKVYGYVSTGSIKEEFRGELQIAESMNFI
ncbi:MAG: hypothetical protein DRN03_00020 [Thermoplasmata archaeon]|nr:MAG: hypothetical protein DRN03_00020 [Thermoplasmata archaeon]